MLPEVLQPPYIMYSIPLFLGLIIIEMVYSYATNKGFYRMGDTIYDLSMGTIYLVWGAFLKFLSIVGYVIAYHYFRIFTIPEDSIAWGIIAFLVYDFFYYWYHRLSHEINFFWAGHSIHHQSEDYNLVVALRQPGINSLFTWVFYVPMAVLGFSPWMFLAVAQLNLVYQFWVHTQAIGKLPRWYEYIFSTPSHHRVHHAINPQYIDKNHGGVFILFDRWFSTFEEEKETPVYGTVKPVASFNPIYSNFKYYLQLMKESFKAYGLKNKIKVWIARPGWYPSTATTPEGYHPIPRVDARTFKKYDPVPVVAITRYVIFWFAFTVILSLGFLLSEPKLTTDFKIILAIFLTHSFLNAGGIFEWKDWAYTSEGIRLATLVAAAAYLFPNPILVLAIGILVFASYLELNRIQKLDRKTV